MTQIFEIKIGKDWKKVRASSLKALSDWSKENNVKDWRAVGMMSRAEILESQSLEIVA
jgi:hypothetical protein